jgi:5-deoxy-glucuronate isomerase
VTERTIWRRELKDQEACVVVLGGTCTVRTAAGEWSLGQREDPFGGPPSAVHVGAGDEVAIEGTPLAFVGVGYARGDATTSARVLTGPRREVRGSGAMERTIHHILMEDQPASSLLVTEVVTPAGHWSSYPPHKHDTDDPPREAKLEEIYYFRFKDPRGFGLMRIYTPDRSLDESIAVCDRDLVLVPRGYHTFSAAPGYDAYYLNVMAGPRREWKITFDPDHERMRW